LLPSGPFRFEPTFADLLNGQAGRRHFLTLLHSVGHRNLEVDGILILLEALAHGPPAVFRGGIRQVKSYFVCDGPVRGGLCIDAPSSSFAHSASPLFFDSARSLTARLTGPGIRLSFRSQRATAFGVTPNFSASFAWVISRTLRFRLSSLPVMRLLYHRD